MNLDKKILELIANENLGELQYKSSAVPQDFHSQSFS